MNIFTFENTQFMPSLMNVNKALISMPTFELIALGIPLVPSLFQSFVEVT